MDASQQLPKFCRSCACLVPNCDGRRRLGAEKTKHIIPIIKETIFSVCPSGVDTIIPHGTGAKSDAFVCKDCFGRIERLIKLRKTTATIQEELIKSAKQVVSYFGLPLLEASSPITEHCHEMSLQRTPVRKRAANSISNSPEKRRRLCYNTPEHVAMTQPIAASTPVVSVIY